MEIVIKGKNVLIELDELFKIRSKEKRYISVYDIEAQTYMDVLVDDLGEVFDDKRSN